VRAIVLVRHASAGDREQWGGDDRNRPLDERGWNQAYGLVDSLAAYDLDRLVTSPYMRCVQTLEPLAAQRGVELELRDELTEGASREEALALIEELRGFSTALCTHGDVVLEILGSELRKGATAILEP
jgi:phosphohistidine phosphatase SixA